MYTNPTIAEFKAYFPRDFTYNADPTLGVTDGDITRALGESSIYINPDLFGDQDEYTFGMMYLTAHFLFQNIKAYGGIGIISTGGGFIASKSVGSVSVSYSIPADFLSNTAFAFLTNTPYGMRYLEFIYPLLHGQVFIACGATQP